MTQLNNEVTKPIINDPYEEPQQYYVIEKGESPLLVEGRREACYYYRPPRRQRVAAQNGLASCVSQAFFPRTSAWDNLKRALKGTYDDSVWDHLAGTVSEPFASGEHNRIAVKVIDDRGNELMVVKSLDEAEQADSSEKGGKRR